MHACMRACVRACVREGSMLRTSKKGEHWNEAIAAMDIDAESIPACVHAHTEPSRTTDSRVEMIAATEIDAFLRVCAHGDI
jgi:hypothetical protein